MAGSGTGVRAQRRQHLEAEILRLGRRQLGEVGAPGVSVRQVARDLGMASSAVYRYVASRDELLTRLITESYESLGDFVERAEAAYPREDVRGRWFAVGHAMREWALSRPHDWALLYGTPVPGYAAPETTIGPAVRVPVLLVQLIQDIVDGGHAAPASRRPPPNPSLIPFAGKVALGLGQDPDRLPPELLLAGVTGWTSVVAAVSSELFGYLGSGVGDHEGLFDYVLEAVLLTVLDA